MAIAYLSKCITIADTDSMCPYDRSLVYKTLVKIKELEKENMDKLMENN